MQLTNEFDVSVPIDEAWRVLTDLERVGPCLPGASITGRDGDDFQGQAKIKVGPITSNYKGTARWVELDEGQYRAVLSAKGREARGGGDAQALVTASLSAQGNVTHVSVITELTLSGKIAQFGRGVITDVSSALLKTFVNRLEAMLQEEPGQGAAANPSDDAPAADSAEPAATRLTTVPATERTEPSPAGSSPSHGVAAAAPASDDDNALSVMPLVRSVVVGRLTKPVPISFVVIAALVGYLFGQRKR
ncbi:SRPBCC family protein [Jatrophihabitans sp. YIM 134969]